MRRRPILFSAPMVRAILAGEKTQTRRVMIGRGAHKGSNFQEERQWCRIEADGTWIGWLRGFSSQEKADEFTQRAYKRGGIVCPYGVVGDRLWVRETWCYVTDSFAVSCGAGYRADESFLFRSFDTAVIPDGSTVYNGLSEQWPANVKKWRPSIFMPRWASRITLEITDVRVQRLQEISDDDCVAEGISRTPVERDAVSPLELYRDIWESINGAGSWDLNPWVWALTFRRVL